ncbi:hypothetical protein [Actinomadura terrae]|uniref:hypothetical protein n=1 Tax=Actinomadura terrae TaxID=604353 RepID=UPI001FA7748A|nr:hypothetical protein [Actinomadura terrae]
MSQARRPVLGAVFGVLTAAALTVCPQVSASAVGPRVDLQVLVVTNGSSSVEAVAAQLKSEGVPYRTVDLRRADRPVIDAAFLSDTVDGVPRAKYQAIVLPNAAPFDQAHQAEMAAIAAYEAKFGIRQLDAYVYPGTNVGMKPPGYSGTLDGTQAQVTAAGKADTFRYLRGPLKFDDLAADVSESYGFLANPLPDDPAHGKSFQPLITATVKNVTGTLAGVYTHDGRSELLLTYSANNEQWQFRTVAHGLVTWLTKGVHLGQNRNYFGVHVDDVFLPDSRWSVEDDCTPGEDCQDGTTTQPIRMEPEDVEYANTWQRQHGYAIDLAFNAAGSDEEIRKNGDDPLTDAFVEARDRFRWINHTYAHSYLGCVQDNSVRPWKCVTDPQTGKPVWVKAEDINQEVAKNIAWAKARGITLDPAELVTGEHSGLRILPQQPDDNPNLVPGLEGTGVKWLAGDASRDPQQRSLSGVRTVPRHPFNVFFNVGTEAEEVDEYNWIYTKRADGGSGICEDNPSTVTCIEPLNADTGYTSYIVPVDTRIALSHIVSNDPRPHYAHQSNITEDRILYTLLESILTSYRATFVENAPLINDDMASLGNDLRRQAAWRGALGAGAVESGEVTAYLQDGTVTVKAPGGLDVPVTAPEGTRQGSDPFGQAYAGERSAYKAGDFTITPPGT